MHNPQFHVSGKRSIALHDEGDLRMEITQGGLSWPHAPILKLRDAILTYEKCLLVFVLYVRMWLQAKYDIVNPFRAIPLGIHNASIHPSDAVRSSILFWTACMRVVASRALDVIWSWVWISCGDEYAYLKWNSWTVSKFDHETTEFYSAALEATIGAFSSHVLLIYDAIALQELIPRSQPCSEATWIKW